MLKEYAMDFIVCHAGEDNNVQYFVRCYSYTAPDDTGEPPAEISELFDFSYWRRMWNEDAKKQK